MSDTPRLRALLVELLKLEDEDSVLPLEILINLHRAQLRVPLTGMVRFAGAQRATGRAALDKLNDKLQHAYGVDGEILENDQGTQDLYGRVNDDTWDSAVLLLAATSVEHRIAVHSIEHWSGFDPVVLLFFISFREVSFEYMPELIEAELAVLPGAHEMILDMAALGSKPKRVRRKKTAAQQVV